MKNKLIPMTCLSMVLLLSACGENNDSNKEKKPAKEKPTTEKVTTEKPTTEAPKKAAENNTVYGKMTDKDAKYNGTIAINKKDSIRYIVDENMKILQVEKDFNDIPLDKNLDHEHIKEHATDFMNDDAKVTHEEENSKTYHSEKLGKDYYVTYSLNEKGEIITIIVSKFK